jgi:cytochrome P450
MYNAKYFPEPDRFNPDRWNLKEGSEALDLHAFLPFSAGPHNCIGQVLMLLINPLKVFWLFIEAII